MTVNATSIKPQVDAVAGAVGKLMSSGFYGDFIISFQNGRITVLEKRETIKLEDLERKLTR